MDGNVQYQDAVRLVQRLIELGKDFEFVTYPIEGHGWQSRSSQLDSQRRMTKLWEEALLVCAYDDREKCSRMQLEGATGLDELTARLPALDHDQEIVFYCA